MHGSEHRHALEFGGEVVAVQNAERGVGPKPDSGVAPRRRHLLPIGSNRLKLLAPMGGFSPSRLANECYGARALKESCPLGAGNGRNLFGGVIAPAQRLEPGRLDRVSQHAPAHLRDRPASG